MAEKCLMVATLAALVFHPSLTIRCFNPKSTPISPQKQKQKPPLEKKEACNSRKKPLCHSKPSLSIWPLRKEPCTVSENFTELIKEETPFQVVEKIFWSGWTLKAGNHVIEKILKVNHNEEVVNRFEEYRKLVKAQTSTPKGAERVAVDGNELLQFQGTLVTCSLGFDGVLDICNKKSCGACRTLHCSLLGKAKPMMVFGSSRAAHEKTSREWCLVKEVSAKKAMLICRVIAGRIGHYHRRATENGDKGKFDSVRASTTRDQSDRSQEIIVCNSIAILPCFLVIYSVP